MTYPHGPRSSPGTLVWPAFPGEREPAVVAPPLSVGDILSRVDGWPLERRQVWAARTLELRGSTGRSLEVCEVEAAEEMERCR